tara:strand:+ start:1681 stop:7917 length:6237 start_codon:yes stop_codon:yes gene_type:complete
MKSIKYTYRLPLLLVVIIISSVKTLTAQSILFTKQKTTLVNSSASTTAANTTQSTTANRTTTSTAGSTLGEFSVSLSGAATYSIPFSVPPGIKNVVPTIGLSYSSQAGNGLVGWGWNISGLSTISRIPTTKFHDNIIDPVDFDSNDRYALDGQRMILKSGTYGATNSEYQTENYSNTKIKAYGTTYGSGPAYFIVYHPDGSKSWYGSSSSGTVNQGARGYLEWALYKKQDPQGNFIAYTYLNDNNILRINTIKYGSNGNATPPNEIRFDYQERTRPETSYVGGQAFKNGSILDKVEIIGGNELNRKYEISYITTSLGYQKIGSVTESNGSNESFSPIQFTYEVTPSNTINTSITDTNSDIYDINNNRLFAGDFDGDGKTDLGTFKVDEKEFSVFKDISNNTSAIKKVTSEKIKQVFSSTILTGVNKILTRQAVTTVSDLSDNVVSFKNYTLNGGVNYEYSKNVTLPNYYTSDCTNGGSRKKAFRYISGDFNGDGLTDVLALGKKYRFSKRHNSWLWCSSSWSEYIYNKQTYFIDLKRTATNSSSSIGNLQEAIADEDKLVTADFNGDGKTDIYHFKEGKVYVYNLSNSNQLELLKIFTNGYIKTDKPILIGDFNGDGKTDFTVSSGSNHSKFYTATGTTFTESTVNYLAYSISTASSQYHYFAQDVNGDGKTDIIQYRQYGDRYFLVTRINSTSAGGSYVFNNQTMGSFQGTNPNDDIITPLILNIKQSNYNPELVCISKRRISVFEFPKSHQQEMTLNSIQNNQITTEINYQKLGAPKDGETSIYTKDESETYPYANINLAPYLKLVKKATKSSGNITQTQNYEYGGAVSHVQGLGFLGFKTFKKTNWYGSGVGTLWNISLHNPQKRSAITSQWFSTSSSSTPYSYLNKTDYTYNTTLAANKVYTNLPTTIRLENKLEGVISTKTISYDSYKNPQTITNSFPGGSKTKTFIYINSTSTSNYYIGRPKNVIETNTLGGETFSSENQMTYNSNHLLETFKKKGNGSTGFVTETFSYDNYGNTLTNILSASGINRSQTFTYDNSGRFLKTSSDIEGLTTTYTYNTKNGNPLTRTNPYGLKTTFAYDGWGRILSKTNYLGNTNNHTYTTTNINGNWAIAKTSTFADGGVEINYYNAFGWLLKSKAKTLGNNYVSKSYEYDAIGRTLRESEPYFTTASQWNQSGYDSYGRMISQQLYTGKVITTRYNGLSVTVSDGTKSKTVTKNAVGNIVKMVDPGGTINYAYFANGSMKEANYGTHIVKTEIDDWGRKKKLIDPAAGTYNYTYNILGEILTETTPKGTTTYQYDGNGKPTNKTIIGDLTNLSLGYQYRSDKLLGAINGRDNIASKNYTYTYGYDPTSKLPTSIKEVTPSANFEKILAYDGLNRIKTEKYINTHTLNNINSTIHIENVYNNAGILTEIKDKTTNASLWEVTEENAKGQAKNINLGNGITKARTYDNFGFLKNIRDTKSGVNALRLDYNFDAKRGVLKSRKNYTFGNWQENFTHDHQDRLTNITGAVSHEQNYDDQGRIDFNSSIGAYNYNTSKIYQLDNIELNTAGDTHFNNHASQQISYNAFKKPISIHQETKGRIDFEYGPLQNRTNAYYGGTQTNKNARRYHKQYSSITPVEIVEDKAEGSVKIIIYVGGDGYTAPIAHIKKAGGSYPVNEYHYLHRDYLGSILAITNSSGTLKEQRQFGAWGKADKFVDSAGNTTFTHRSLIGRGYTGHEHFFEVDLIHMNGRMYDANLGRFLSPDNYIQDPFNTQNYNRYGYVLNNPLSIVDPSGESFLLAIVIGAIIGGYAGGALANGSLNPFDWTWDSGTWTAIIGGAIIGGLGGAAYSYGQLSGVLLSAGIGKGAAIPIAAFEIGAGTTSLGLLGLGTIASWKNSNNNKTNETFIEAFSQGSTNSYGNKSGSQIYAEGTYDDWVIKPEKGDLIDELALVSSALSMRSSFIYNKKGGYWRGKNGTFYSTSVNGNGSTGGKYKYARTTGKFLNRSGGIFSAYGIGVSINDKINGDIETGRFLQDNAFNIAGYLGAPGAAASFGYSSGNIIEDWCNCNIQVNWGNVGLFGKFNIPMWFEPLEGRDY